MPGTIRVDYNLPAGTYVLLSFLTDTPIRPPGWWTRTAGGADRLHRRRACTAGGGGRAESHGATAVAGTPSAGR